MKITYKRLHPTDIADFRQLMDIFGEEFNDKNTYQDATPDEDYIKIF